jgi:hypothetical protein
MANKIQLRRDTTANWTRVNPILDDGEPGLEIDTNKVKYGDGNTAWNTLAYASGGLTDENGVVAFPGDLLIGTLWPEDPINGMSGDKESVVWAKDDTEYLGLWWGGDQTYPEMGYGPVAGIMIGAYARMTDDFTGDPSPADTNVTIGINDSNGDTLEWRFDRDGMFTLPQGSTISEIPAAETVTLDQLTDISSWTGTLVFTKNGAIYQALPNGPIMRLVGSTWLIQHALTSWFSSTDLITWVVGPYAGTTAPVGTLSVATTNLTVGADTWTFGADGNLTIPGEIKSAADTGPVTIQASDGNNPRNFVFNTSGSLSLPHLATGGQGAGAFDANNNMLTLTSGDTVNFANFSGMILVNTHYSGGVSLYLCGGGSGSAVSIGDSKSGNSVGTMAFNGGIGGYTFTADETGNHVFCAIRTRTGA